MSLTIAQRVWNRALEPGVESLRPGDRALAAMLGAHGLVMNGGVHHALECLTPQQLLAAADGYAFFGLDDVAAFFRGASDDPVLSQWTEDTEDAANLRYWEMVPDDDASLVTCFEIVFLERGDQFAPLEPTS